MFLAVHPGKMSIERRTNTTKEIMENIAKIIGADVAEYTDGRDRSGFPGYVGACFATVNNTISKVLIR